MPPLYPAEWAGAGLLLLRLAVAGSLLAITLSFASTTDWRQAIALFVAVALCVGVLARAFAVLSIVAAIYALAIGADSSALALLHIVFAAALALTGPGAFSADARLFGRRRVILSGARDTSE
jgi:hypothetical protein